MRARAVLHQITPPIVASAWQRRRQSDTAPSWEYLGEEWVDDDGPGWDTEGVVAAYRAKLPDFRKAIAAPACIGVPTEALSGLEPAQYHQNVALEYAYAVACASRGPDQIKILDWGGGFGFLSFVLRELFPDLTIEYHVKEMPSIARAARDLVREVTFWDDDDCLDQHFDLTIASGSFQYFPQWRDALRRLARASDFVMLGRLPVTPAPRSFMVKQHAYDTHYNGWIFSRDELVQAATPAELVLLREFTEGWSAFIPDAPGPNEHRAFLFQRRRGN